MRQNRVRIGKRDGSVGSGGGCRWALACTGKFRLSSLSFPYHPLLTPSSARTFVLYLLFISFLRSEKVDSERESEAGASQAFRHNTVDKDVEN